MSKLEQVYREAERIIIDKSSKIVCMSDCHRGVGNHGDNFLTNQHLFLAALQYYYDRHFCYFELGDGDELWENKSLSKIAEVHRDAFDAMCKFHQGGRLRMLYGNHDCAKKNEGGMKVRCRKCNCDCEECEYDLFPGLHVLEGIVLTDKVSKHEIFLVHGHQGDLWNDTLWPVACLLVRFVWRPLEMLGIADPTSAAYNYKKCKKTERRLDAFSKKKQMLLITGHTHRSILPKPGEGFYLNDGSCVHPKGITAMELENGAISLVKWSVTVRRDNALAVTREILEGPIPWEAYWSMRPRPSI